MRVTFLNLDRSTERLASFLAANSHLSDLHRVSGVDGKLLSRADLQNAGVLQGDMETYTQGAIGGALSHMMQWQVTAKRSDVLTLAEDDAVMHGDFEPLAARVIASLPSDWDIIQWGWNFDSILSFELLPGVSPCVGVFDQEGLRKNIAEYQRSQIHPVAYRLNRSFGLMCQSISPAGAAKLLKHCVPIRPMQVHYPLLNRTLENRAIDDMMNDLYPQINAFVSFPPLAVSKNEHEISTIQTG